MKLYTYWRSQAAYRVRIALSLKGLETELIALDILKGEQFADEYRRINPQHAVPTLVDGENAPILQSLAILEYLEERYPEPSLLPQDLRARAYVRGLALMLIADSHPFVTPRVRNYLEHNLKIDAAARARWMQHWMIEGLTAFETQLARAALAGQCCLGNAPTLADLCLVAHVTTCKIFPRFDFAPYPIAVRIFDHCMTLKSFSSTTPSLQADAPVAASK